MTLIAGTVQAEGLLNLEEEPLVPSYIEDDINVQSITGMQVEGHHVVLEVNTKTVKRWQLMKQIEHLSEDVQAEFISAWIRQFREEKGRYNVKASKVTKSITDWSIRPTGELTIV